MYTCFEKNRGVGGKVTIKGMTEFDEELDVMNGQTAKWGEYFFQACLKLAAWNSLLYLQWKHYNSYMYSVDQYTW